MRIREFSAEQKECFKICDSKRQSIRTWSSADEPSAGFEQKGGAGDKPCSLEVEF